MKAYSNKLAISPSNKDKNFNTALQIILLFLGFIFARYFSLEYSGVIYDDAYISFRYARMAATGRGLVFNDGEYVQGYTNFLWTVLHIPSFLLGIDVVSYSQYLGLLFFALSGLVLFRIADYLFETLPVRWALPITYWFTPVVFLNATRGLETPLFSFLSLLVLYSALAFPSGFASGFFAALLLLTRLDGLLLVAPFIGFGIYKAKQRKIWTKHCMYAFFSIMLPYVIWATWYYGSIIPNTFYAKLGISNSAWVFIQKGLNYVWKKFLLTLRFTTLFTFIVLAVTSKAFWAGLQYVAILAALLFYLAYFISAGGDSIGGYRVASILFPLALMLALTGIDQLLMQKKTLPYLIGFCLLTLCGISCLGADAFPIEPVSSQQLLICAGISCSTLLFCAIFPKLRFIPVTAWILLFAFSVSWSTRNAMVNSQKREKYIVGRFIEGGQILKKIAPKECFISTSAAGAIPFFSELGAIDELGLTDAHIGQRKIDLATDFVVGHIKGDGQYILDRRPCLLLFESYWFHDEAIETFQGSWLPSQNEMLTKYKQRMFADYEPVNIRPSELLNWRIAFYKRRDVKLRNLISEEGTWYKIKLQDTE